MKNLVVILALAAIAAFALPDNLHAFNATCTGATPCRACKNCKYCKHCAKDGGTCGVCKVRTSADEGDE